MVGLLYDENIDKLTKIPLPNTTKHIIFDEYQEAWNSNSFSRTSIFSLLGIVSKVSKLPNNNCRRSQGTTP